MVIINNNITEEPCQLYNSNDELVGEIKNLFAFNDVRIQIKENKYTGYYFLFKGEKITIDKNGTLNHYPDGLFDKIDEQLRNIVFV